MKKGISFVNQKDLSYVRRHCIHYADNSIIVWTSIFSKAYNKNVTSFLKEDLLMGTREQDLVLCIDEILLLFLFFWVVVS
jgi:hypothetical protein